MRVLLLWLLRLLQPTEGAKQRGLRVTGKPPLTAADFLLVALRGAPHATSACCRRELRMYTPPLGSVVGSLGEDALRRGRLEVAKLPWGLSHLPSSLTSALGCQTLILPCMSVPGNK